MLAFHNNPEIKSAAFQLLHANTVLNQLVNKQSRTSRYGCPLSYLAYSRDDFDNEHRLGIPVILLHLGSAIHQGAYATVAQEWPQKFLNSIEVGSNLSLVGWRFLHWLLTDPGINLEDKHPFVKVAVITCADIIHPLTAGNEVDARELAAAKQSAANAEKRVYETDWSPAISLAASAAACAQWCVDCAMPNTDDAGIEECVFSAVRDAALSTTNWGTTCQKMSDKLIELIVEAGR